MADGGSALESQQAIGTRIPYENIDAEQKGLGLALGTFYHAAEVSKQRQQLENSLLATQMRVGEQARWHDIEMKNLEQSSALKLYGMGLREQSMNDRFNIAAERLGLAKDVQDFKVAKDQETTKSASDLMRSFTDLDPGAPDFQKNYFSALASNARGAETPLGRVAAKQIGDTHNKAVSRQWDKYNSDMREFGFEVGTRIWGDRNKQDMAPIEHPEMWKQQYVNDKGETAGPEVAGQPGWKPSNKKFFPLYLVDPNTGMAKLDANGKPQVKDFRTFSIPELNQMTQRYKEFQTRKNTIPQQIVTDDVKPVTASTASSPFPPAPQDPSQRVLNQKYSSPNGKIGTWTAQGWVTD